MADFTENIAFYTFLWYNTYSFTVKGLFDMFEKEIEETKIERDGGIYVEEKNFPERILSVEVRLKDGSTRIIEEDE